MNSYVLLFRHYGWEVETLGDNSFIASNGTFFVPFSLDPLGYVSAVSFLCCDKEDFIKVWQSYNEGSRHPTPIGYYAFSLVMNGNKKFMRFGGICNHDHDTFEIENWLSRLAERSKAK